MLKRIIICLCIWLSLASFAYALQGYRGDLIVAGSAINSEVMLIQNKVRAFNEALLIMGVPRYAFGNHIIDQQLIEENFIFHVEILSCDWTFTNCGKWTWERYRFTDLGKSMLDPGWAGDLYVWIVDQSWRYKLPFDVVSETYRKYARGEVLRGNIPLMMIGTAYGQTVEDYTDFADFYGNFMLKHHYCITASVWALYKAIYDKCSWMRLIYEESFSDSQVVQSFDTLTGGRLVGFLLSIGFIEEY